MDKLIKELARFVKEFPEQWQETSSGIKHTRTNIELSAHRKYFLIPNVTVKHQAFSFAVGYIKSKELRKVIRCWKRNKRDSDKLESIDHIETALYSLEGVNPLEAIKLKKNKQL